MKAMGLKGFTKRRRCVTTRRKPGHRVMPDLVGRKFTANEPNRVYVGDITYLPCKGGPDPPTCPLSGGQAPCLTRLVRPSSLLDCALLTYHGPKGPPDNGGTPDHNP